MIGNYFKTGKTIVIDDQYEEAQPLLNSLYDLGIPHHYSDGSPSTLPKKPLHFRLIFLDLELISRTSMHSNTAKDDYKNFKSKHIGILDKVLKNNNESFILVIWSTEKGDLEDPFKEIFDLTKDQHTNKKPYKIIPLEKRNYFNQGVFIETKKDQLYREIKDELKDLDAFKTFCEWETKINDSAGETFDAILQTVNSFKEKEKGLSQLITLLSIAHSGDSGFLGLTTNQKKTDAVLLALNEILHDDVDRLVLDQREEEFKNWAAKDKAQITGLRKGFDNGSINAKLFTYTPNKPELTGSIYQVKRGKEPKAIYDDAVNLKKIESEVIAKFKRENNNQGPDPITKNHLVEEFNKNLYQNLVQPVELNVTPLCDVSQGNDPVHRIIPGLIIPESNKAFFICRGYCSQRFSANELITNLNDNVFLLLDFRYFKSLAKSSIKSRTKDSKKLPRYLFTLRNNLVNDIQISLSNHVSRLGVLSLQDK